MSKKSSQKTSTHRTSRRPASPPPANNRLWLWIGLGALVVVLLGALAFIPGLQAQPTAGQAGPVAAAGLPDEISVQEASALRDEGAFILDVRTPEEWADHHIPGSTLIPLDELESRLNEVPQGQDVVVVCRSGNRSAAGRDILRQGGIENVTSMAGGLNQWKSAGYSTVAGQ